MTAPQYVSAHQSVIPEGGAVSFLVFALAEAAQGAQAAPSPTLGGCQLRVTGAALSPVSGPKAVFVQHLPRGISEDEVREVLGTCGPVESVRLVRERYSGITQGFGFVQFPSLKAAKKALTLDQQLSFPQFPDVPPFRIRPVKESPKAKSSPSGKTGSQRKGPSKEQKKSGNAFQGEEAQPFTSHKRKKPSLFSPAKKSKTKSVKHSKE